MLKIISGKKKLPLVDETTDLLINWGPQGKNIWMLKFHLTSNVLISPSPIYENFAWPPTWQTLSLIMKLSRIMK